MQQRRDELADASPGALLNTRRRFLTVAGAAAVLAFSTRLPGIESARSSARALPGYPFTLGIASGDPLPDAVVLWTRLAPVALDPFGGMPYTAVPVDWEVAEDDAFKRIVQRGTATALPEFAHSVHVDVQGLAPGREYFYRFTAGGEQSPVGRTRTAPALDQPLSALAFAFVSCQRWEDGFFTAYKHLAQEDLDVVFHLGDYMYEYGIPATGDSRRTPVPEALTVETDSLDQYRLRYALYKTDPDLQAAHAAFPFIVTWDDHETDNNYAGAISENADPTAKFLVRRANAYRAYWENMPLRPLQAPKGPDMQLYRRLRFGDLAEFNVLDTRQYRDDQPCGGGSTSDCPDRFAESRTILGATQRDWLLDGLAASTTRWNVLAQQVLMSEIDNNVSPTVHNVPTDAWDGYVADRIRVANAFTERNVKNPVVLAGDIHRNSAADLKGDYRPANAPVVAPEFTCTSITSAGDGDDVTAAGTKYLEANPHLRFTNSQRGYVRCQVTPEQWRTGYRVVPYVSTPGAPVSTRASFVVHDGNPRMETA